MPHYRPNLAVRVVPLSSPEAGDSRMGGSIAERVNAVAVLTETAWKLAGRPFPQYTRATMPVVLATLQDHAESL